MKKLFAVLAAMFLLALMACSGGGGGGGGNTTTPKTYSITGQITSNYSKGLVGVTVLLSGANTAQTITDSSGNYSFTGLTNGSYTVTPSKTGYTFSPANLSPVISGADRTWQNFTSSPALVWTGTEWKDVDWNTVSAGLSEMEKLSITDKSYAKVGNNFYKVVGKGYTTPYGTAVEELQKSNDGGITWSPISKSFAGIYSVDVIDNTLYVTYSWRVEQDHEQTYIEMSDDGGNTWTTYRHTTSYDTYAGVCSFKSNIYFIYAMEVINGNTGDISGIGNVWRIVATNNAMYALGNSSTDGAIYETFDGINWHLIGTNIASYIFVFNNQLYAFPSN